MNNKPLYEKIGIFIGIIAGICTILGISVFGGKELFKDTKTADTTVILENNEINTDNQSPVVIGNNNTFNYENTDSDNESNESSESKEDKFSVKADYETRVVQISPSGIDVLVKAKTLFSADHVTISAKSDEFEAEPINMHGNTYNWYFLANFYIKGSYTVTVTAYSSDGKSTSDTFTYVY